MEFDVFEWRRNRLRELLAAYGGNSASLGRKAGYKDGAFIGQMLRGERPIKEETVPKLESAAGRPGWFKLPDGQAQAAAPVAAPRGNSKGDTEILEFDTGGAMGHGLVLQDQPGVIRKWVVSPEWVQQNVHRITSAANLVIVTGFGDSMRPLYNPGDPLLVDRGITRADVDGVYFFRVGNEGFVKRLQRIPTVDGVVIRAKSENEKYDSFDIIKGMDFEVFGRVVKAWRGEEF